MERNRKTKLITAGTVGALALGLFCSANLISASVVSTLETDEVTIEQVQAEGYPVNANGETYGPTFDNNEADLIQCTADSGAVGYLRKTEIEEDQPGNPEEALAMMENFAPQTYNVYLSDGETVIGEFTVGENTYTYEGDFFEGNMKELYELCEEEN